MSTGPEAPPEFLLPTENGEGEDGKEDLPELEKMGREGELVNLSDITDEPYAANSLSFMLGFYLGTRMMMNAVEGNNIPERKKKKIMNWYMAMHIVTGIYSRSDEFAMSPDLANVELDLLKKMGVVKDPKDPEKDKGKGKLQ